jgi:SAM-dependent methyltransferase
MADVQQNLSVWEDGWDWSTAGDEWSSWCGGTPALWHGALLPRIHSFVPTGTILEIAPGFGRWTQYLKDLCDELVIVDLTERCIEGCKQRFADADNIEYHVNDGRSLEMVPDQSIDFVFSFDSLVHAESDILDAYAHQLVRKLKPDGIGFIHHSNSGHLRGLTSMTKRVPERVRRPLVTRGVLPDAYAWRAQSVTAESFARQCEAAGLACVSQEKINWEWGLYLLDSLTVFTPRGSRWDRPLATRRNPLFHAEATRMASHYSSTAFPRHMAAT